MKKFICLGLSLLWFNTSLAAVQEIDVSDNQFTPAVVDVNQGDTVRWINRDTVSHTIEGGFASSGPVGPAQRFEFVFNEAGNFDYISSLQSGMTGTIRVAAVTVTNDALDETGAVDFSDLFGTGTSNPPADLSETADLPQLEATQESTVITNNTPAVVNQPVVPPTPVAPVTVNFNEPVAQQTIAKAAQNNAILPTAGGDNVMIYLAVLALVGLFLFLSGAIRR